MRTFRKLKSAAAGLIAGAMLATTFSAVPAQPTEAHQVQGALEAQPCCHLTNLSPLPFTVLFFLASSSFCSLHTSPHSKVIKCTGSAVIQPPQSIYGSGPQPLWKFPKWEAGD